LVKTSISAQTPHTNCHHVDGGVMKRKSKEEWGRVGEEWEQIAPEQCERFIIV